MKVYRTFIEYDSHGNAIGEKVLGQIDIKYGDPDQFNSEVCYDKNRNRTLVAINYNITASDKSMTKKKGATEVAGWESKVIEWQENNILKLTTNYGISNATYVDGYRRGDDVISYNSIMLDFDKHDKTLEDLKTEFKKFSGTYFIFSSTNHTPEAPKLRVWIPLSRSINEKELEAFKDVMIKRYPTLDGSCFAKSRYWYFTPAKEYYFSPRTDFLDVDQYLSIMKLIPEIDEEINDDSPDNKKTDEKKKNRNTWKFSLDTKVLLADKKTEILIKDIKSKTRIFCPICGLKSDRGNPNMDNAFVDINSIGNYYIYCSSENHTYWEERPSFNENNFLFIHDSSGMVCRPTADGFDTFKNDTDWYNFCFNYKLNPACRYYIPRRRVMFNPSKPPRFFSQKEMTMNFHTGKNEEMEILYFNTFISNKYLDKDRSSHIRIRYNDIITYLKDKCEYSYKVLKNLLGQDEYIQHFINWNAVILQKRIKQRTGWLITTKVHGAGKDFLFVRMLSPIYGNYHSKLLRGDEMGDKFNSIFMNSWLQGFNEIFSKGSYHINIRNREWVKAMITAIKHSVEKKYMDKIEIECFMNFLFFSNSDHAMMIEKGDRRLNIIRNPYAVKLDTLDWYPGDINFEKLIDSELENFSDLLLDLEYDEILSSQVLETEAKEKLTKVSTEGVDLFIEALQNADLNYFLLDEVFPDTDNAESTKINRTRRAWVEDTILKLNAIPRVLLKYICKTHFSTYSYTEIRKKLENRGLVSTTVRSSSSAHLAVYKIKSDFTKEEDEINEEVIMEE